MCIRPPARKCSSKCPTADLNHPLILRLTFGLGNDPEIDSVTVLWENDKQQVIRQIRADSTYILNQKDASIPWKPEREKDGKRFTDVTATSGIDFSHKEADYVDYNQNPLIKQMYSRLGPALAVGDVNKDGLDDVYIGGAIGQGGRLYMQNKGGNFTEKTLEIFAKETKLEASDAVFFDADNDSDLDLLVVSGSNEFKDGDDVLLPKLYLNDGKGNFFKSTGFPALKINASCIAAADYDKDGDTDIFIGSRLKSGQYGVDPPSYLFTNDGTGGFKNETKSFIPEIAKLGMVSDALWADLDGDNYPELVVAGDWMPVMVFKNKKNKLELQAADIVKNTKGEIVNTSGWWNTLEAADIDKDGDLDIIAGNLGLNSRLKASQQKPVEMYVKDFDRNGIIKQIITCPDETDTSYPMVMKPDLLRAMPSLKKKFVKYEQYAGKTIEEVISKEDLADAIVKKVYTAESAILRNESKGSGFTFMPLPQEAQFSPIFSIIPTDYDHDGNVDLIISGNYFDVLPEIGRYDGLKGLVLRNTQKGFEVKHPSETGLWLEGQVRTMKLLKQGQLIITPNNTPTQVFRPGTLNKPTYSRSGHHPPAN